MNQNGSLWIAIGIVIVVVIIGGVVLMIPQPKRGVSQLAISRCASGFVESAQTGNCIPECAVGFRFSEQSNTCISVLTQMNVPVYLTSKPCPSESLTEVTFCSAEPITVVGEAKTIEEATRICNEAVEWKTLVGVFPTGEFNETGTNYEYFTCQSSDCQLGTVFCNYSVLSGDEPPTPKTLPSHLDLWIPFCYPKSYVWGTTRCELVG